MNSFSLVFNNGLSEEIGDQSIPSVEVKLQICFYVRIFLLAYLIFLIDSVNPVNALKVFVRGFQTGVKTEIAAG